MAVKAKTLFTCQQCGADFPKWQGQCDECGDWNTLVESETSSSKFSGFTGMVTSRITKLSEVELHSEPRLATGLTELDRVLGGGLVIGSVVLIGGDPGIGKSTLLIQSLCQLSQKHTALYVTGEESLEQVTVRSRRLGLPQDKLLLLAETQVERIIALAQETKPAVMVIDSMQTIYTEGVTSAPGSVSQVRESAAKLTRYAKQTGTAIFIVGHVTKEGTLAGPRVLEHMVDSVLYFEGDRGGRYRIIRAVKNRFGAVNELGVFAMADTGLKQVANPSSIFLSNNAEPVSGSAVTVTWEGSRPMLVEVQALVDQSYLANPRRVTVGLEQNRLSILLAVLHRHGGIPSYDQDVFINVVGGVKVSETTADLAILLAILSSLKNKPLPQHLVVFGEVGLAGEIRPVQSGQERLREAAKHGFKQAIVPKANAPKSGTLSDLEIIPVTRLSAALAAIK